MGSHGLIAHPIAWLPTISLSVLVSGSAIGPRGPVNAILAMQEMPAREVSFLPTPVSLPHTTSETCPNDCSGQGRCLSLQDASRFMGLDYDVTAADSGDGLGVGESYSYWDKQASSLCVCDFGFFGPDCSLGDRLSSSPPALSCPHDAVCRDLSQRRRPRHRQSKLPHNCVDCDR
jgi:hypothetical protein